MRTTRRVRGLVVLAAAAILGVAAAAQAQPGITLKAGDIIVLNVKYQNGSVEHIDPVTDVKTTLASGSEVTSPRGVAFSPEGLLYVADTFNDWVVRIDPDSGEITPVAGISAIGRPDPEAMIADEASGWDLLLVEADDPRILRIDPVTGLTSTEFRLTGTRFPIGLTRDPTDGSLLVADRFSGNINHYAGVHRIDVTTGLQTAVSLKEQYLSLRRIGAQSDGAIILSDNWEPMVYRIPGNSGTGLCEEDFCTAGRIGESCASNLDCDNSAEPAQFGSCGPTFDGPNGIAVDTDDSVLVTDESDGSLYRLSPDGGTCTPIHTSLGVPWDVAIVPALETRKHEEFLVSDAGTSLVYSVDSTNDERNPIADDSGSSLFTQPVALAWTDPAATLATGEIYVIDGPTSIVRRNLATGVQDPIASGGDFDELSDIAIDFAGDILVTDRFDGQLIRVDPSGAPDGEQTVLTSELGQPTALVVDAEGSVIVIDPAPPGDVATDESDSGLFRINPLNGEVEQFAANLEFGFAGVSPGPVEFNQPIALARDPRIGLLLLDHGDSDVPDDDYDDPLDSDDDKVKPEKLYRILGSENPLPNVGVVALATSGDGTALGEATAIAFDGNRDPIVAFAIDEPVRIEPLTGAGTTLTVDGFFAAATDLLIEGMPEPGEVLDADGDLIPNGFDNCSEVANADQADVNVDGQGDVCQIGDRDLDGFPDEEDTCEEFPNPEQRTCSEGLVDAACFVDLDCADPETGLCEDDFCTAGRIGQSCLSDPDCDNPAGPGICESDVCTTGLMNEDCSDNSDCDDFDRPASCGFMQFDSDGDGFGADCDNCPEIANFEQEDLDGNGIGDDCDDSDGDGNPGYDIDDNCPEVPNGPTCSEGLVGDSCLTDADCDVAPGDGVCDPGQEDGDGDGVGDACDNCPTDSNSDQSNVNIDDEGSGPFIGDECQNDVTGDDGDDDGWPDAADNCPADHNPDQADFDGDAIPGVGGGDACDDSDGDGDNDADDNCPELSNPNQSDDDEDGVGDVCDNCPDDENPSQYNSNAVNEPGEEDGDACEAPDSDADGWPDAEDNCPDTYNLSFDDDGDGVDDGQSDVNGDGFGDACQPNDLDGDGWSDFEDNCPNIFNDFQGDQNHDEEEGARNGDQCQAGDSDGDGWPDGEDNCPYYFNPVLGTCLDGDVGAICFSDDDCGPKPNSDFCEMIQVDQDGDTIGDVCDPIPLPEPGGTLMLMSGLGTLALLARRRARHALRTAARA